MTWIKICANTTLEDAQAAADLGADAVGFVFAPSTRRVTPEAAGRINAQLTGKVEKIGVFQTIDFDAIRSAIPVAGLTGVQLHGGYEPKLIEALRAAFGEALTIAQTLHWRLETGPQDGGMADELKSQIDALRRQGLVDRILIDSKVGSALGGTGKTFDWKEAKSIFSEAQGMRMIVAGGLNPQNVGDAIRQIRPWGVDVASGVESEPGRKDRNQLKLLIESARIA